MHDNLKMLGAFSWSELMTSKPKLSIKFYKNLIGWDIEKIQVGGKPYHVIKVNGEEIAGISEYPEENRGLPARWETFITVFDVDATVNAAIPLGTNIVIPPEDIAGIGRFCTIRHEDGGKFSLIEWDEDPVGGQDPPVYVHGSITWSGLQTNDATASKNYLASLLGVELEMFNMGGRTYFVIQPEDPAGGTTGDLAEPLQPKSSGPVDAEDWIPPDDPPFWLPCIQVDDVDHLSTKVENLGGSMVTQPTDVAGVGRICTIMDPLGGRISLISYFT